MSATEEVDVFVCGAGPVGLFFTYQMAMRGHSVYCIDIKPGPTNQSRALLITVRTMEIFENKGLGVDILHESRSAAGLRLFHNGKVIGQAHSCGDTPYPHIIVLNQGKTEDVIKQRIERDTACKIHWETELVSYTQDENGVTSVVRSTKDDTIITTVRSKWIIGADGSHSKVRKGNPEWTYNGVAISTRLLLGDLNIHGENIENMMDRMNAFITESHILGMVRLSPMNENDDYSHLFRIFCNMEEYKVDGNQNRLSHGLQEEAAPSLEEIQELMDKITTPLKFTVSNLVWSSYFRINERMANGFRKGRAFLIGDSAHCHSPAGGQGMNLGLHDADNLAWKLSAVLDGIARNPEELLDSFDSEREPHAKATIEATSRGTRNALTDSSLLRIMRLLTVSVVLKVPLIRDYMFKTVTQQFVAIDPEVSKLMGTSDKGLIKAGAFLPDTGVLRKTFIAHKSHFLDRVERLGLRDILVRNTQYVAIFIGTCFPYHSPNMDLIEKFWKYTRAFPIRRIVVQSVWHIYQAKELPSFISKDEYEIAEHSFFGEERIDLPISLTQRVGLYPLLASFFASTKPASVVLFVRPDLYISQANLVNNEAELNSALAHLSSIFTEK